MTRRHLLALLFAAVPGAALACPVCFGQNDSAMASGTNMGIFLMLGLVVLMFAGFASFFVVLMRRARGAALKGPRDTDGVIRRAPLPGAPAQEGTA